MSKKEGLYTKYHVEKIGRPDEKLDCIVLEFDDPIARVGIQAWASEMNERGYHKCAAEVFAKLLRLQEASHD
jgi:hypothetical protein